MFKTSREAAQYLSAIIDGEGTVECKLPPRNQRRRITIVNTDQGIIDATMEALAVFGVVPNVRAVKSRAAHYRQAWIIEVGNRIQLLRLIPHLELRSTKRATLPLIVASYGKYGVGKGAKLPRELWPVAELRSLIAAGYSNRMLAAHFGKHQKTIEFWKRETGSQTALVRAVSS